MAIDAAPPQPAGTEATPALPRGKTLVQHFLRQVAERPTAPALYFRVGERFARITWAGPRPRGHLVGQPPRVAHR
jgi:hypothetical protein